MKRQNDRILKEELPRSVGAQHATGDHWRNNSRMNEGIEPKQKQYSVVEKSTWFKAETMWSTGEGSSKPLQYSCLENPRNSMKKQNDRILKEELPRLVGAQYATGDQWRNNSRKNEGMEPKQKEYPAVGVTGDRSKV